MPTFDSICVKEEPGLDKSPQVLTWSTSLAREISITQITPTMVDNILMDEIILNFFPAQPKNKKTELEYDDVLTGSPR